MRHHRPGLLLIDLMVAMAIVGVVLLAVLPTLRSEAPLQLIAGSTMLSADIEYAQSRTLASPSDPTIVVVEDGGTGYRLARLSDPDTPIDDPDGEPWRRIFGVGPAGQLEGCTLTTYDLPTLGEDGPEVIVFDAFGRLEGGTDAAFSINNRAGFQVVHVRQATGSVSILAQLPAGFVDGGKQAAKGAGGFPAGGQSLR